MLIMENKDLIINIANNIRAERNRARLSQEELAEKIGMNPKHFGAIERGEFNPKITTIIAIIEALNISFYDLYRTNKN